MNLKIENKESWSFWVIASWRKWYLIYIKNIQFFHSGERDLNENNSLGMAMPLYMIY